MSIINSFKIECCNNSAFHDNWNARFECGAYMVDGVEGREYPRYLCVIRPCYLRHDTMNNDIIVPSDYRADKT